MLSLRYNAEYFSATPEERAVRDECEQKERRCASSPDFIIFSKSYHFVTPEQNAIYDTLHPEFRTYAKFPEYLDDWSITVNNETSMIYSVNSRNPDILYTAHVNINNSCDYWFYQRFFSIDGIIRIIHSDYDGLRLMDAQLNTLFHIPRTAEMIVNYEVYGFDIDETHFTYWVITQYVQDEHKRMMNAMEEQMYAPFKDLPKRIRKRLMLEQDVYSQYKFTNVYTDSRFIPENEKWIYTF
jgi:hypothetical protein